MGSERVAIGLEHLSATEGDACEAETAALLQLQKGLEKWHFGGIVPGDSDYQRFLPAVLQIYA